MIHRSEATVNDSLFNIGQLLTEKEHGFFISAQPSRELPYKNLFHNAITFEVTLTNTMYVRRVYNFLELVGDLGGLFGAVWPLFSLLT